MAVADTSCSCAAEYSMFVSHGIWLLRTRGIRQRAKVAQLPFDEFPEAVEWQDGGWKFHWTFFGMRPRKTPTTETELDPNAIEQQQQ